MDRSTNRRRGKANEDKTSDKTKIRRMIFEDDYFDDSSASDSGDNGTASEEIGTTTIENLDSDSASEGSYAEEPRCEDEIFEFTETLNKATTSNHPQIDPEPFEQSEQEIFDFVLSMTNGQVDIFQPLYAQSKHNLIDVLIKITTIFKRYKVSRAELGEWLEHINDILPDDNIYPQSTHIYMELSKKLTPKLEEPKVDYYCASCMFEYGDKDLVECPSCSMKLTAVCVQNNIESVFKHMLENRGLWKHLENTFHVRKPGVISDLIDGEVAKSVPMKTVYDMRCIQNTDGFPYASSSTKQIWGNYLSIAEIAPNLRSHYMILAGFWFAPKKANLSKFMTPFVLQMKKLGIEGLTWNHPQLKIPMKSHIYIIASTVDAQARAPLLVMNYYNSKFGCGFCEIEGKDVQIQKQGNKSVAPTRGKKTVQVYPYQKQGIPARTHSTIIKYAKQMYENMCKNVSEPKHIKGIQGISPMAVLPYFDLSASMSPDILHSCMVGVVKRNIMKILSSKNHKQPYYIGRMSILLDKKIESLQFPAFVTRLPRSTEFISFWKASEFRSYLLFFSLPCLEGLIKIEYFQHHCLLVDAIYTLCKTEITFFDLQRAREELDLYCSEYTKLYGIKEMTFNLHMLTHYANAVESLGPLGCHSTFSFENANGLLRTSIHGTQNVAMELINTTNLHNSLHVLTHIREMGKIRSKTACDYSKLQNPLIRVGELDRPSAAAIKKFLIGSNENYSRLKLYSKCQIRRITYTCESYKKAIKTCSYFIAYKQPFDDENQYAKVIAYFIVDQVKYFAARKIVSLGPAFKGLNNFEVKHIFKYNVEAEIIVLEVSCIQFPLYKILDDYLAEPPNMYEINL